MKTFLIIISFVLLLSGAVMAQEVTINGFPVGIGSSVNPDIFIPYHDELGKMVDSLNKYPLALAMITGSADGQNYPKENDVKNPALALGRAHALRMYLLDNFELNKFQIIVSSDESKIHGKQFRYAHIRLIRDLAQMEGRIGRLESFGPRIDELEKREPVEKHFTDIIEVNNIPDDDYRFQLSAGISSSPFGGIPMVTGAVNYKEMFSLELIAGHTFWNNDFSLNDTTTLETKRRLLGGQLVYYPDWGFPIGFIGGWIRIEEISQQYYEYVSLSEGPMFGVKLKPLDFLAVTAVYNPSKERIVPNPEASSQNDRFLFSLTFYNIFGGAK